jgi:hypothetical protein
MINNIKFDEVIICNIDNGFYKKMLTNLRKFLNERQRIKLCKTRCGTIYLFIPSLKRRLNPQLNFSFRQRKPRCLFEINSRRTSTNNSRTGL